MLHGCHYCYAAKQWPQTFTNTNKQFFKEELKSFLTCKKIDYSFNKIAFVGVSSKNEILPPPKSLYDSPPSVVCFVHTDGQTTDEHYQLLNHWQTKMPQHDFNKIKHWVVMTKHKNIQLLIPMQMGAKGMEFTQKNKRNSTTRHREQRTNKLNKLRQQLTYLDTKKAEFVSLFAKMNEEIKKKQQQDSFVKSWLQKDYDEMMIALMDKINNMIPFTPQKEKAILDDIQKINALLADNKSLDEVSSVFWKICGWFVVYVHVQELMGV